MARAKGTARFVAYRMEPLWSPAGATGGNGQERANRSSPLEDFQERPVNTGFPWSTRATCVPEPAGTKRVQQRAGVPTKTGLFHRDWRARRLASSCPQEVQNPLAEPYLSPAQWQVRIDAPHRGLSALLGGRGSGWLIVAAGGRSLLPGEVIRVIALAHAANRATECDRPPGLRVQPAGTGTARTLWPSVVPTVVPYEPRPPLVVWPRG